MKGASGTPDPPCVSECPNVRMSECPNTPIRMRKQSDAKTDRRAASIDVPTRRRRFATPVDAVDAGRRRTPTDAKTPTVCDANGRDDATTRIRTRDDEDALERARTLTGRRVGAARDEAEARWGSRRRC